MVKRSARWQNNPMSASDKNDSVSKARQHLASALEQLETKAGTMSERLRFARDAQDVDEDRARLAAELDEARTRAAVMEDAAREAGEALDAAISDVRAALGESN
jgi:predicted  nucleic acid-binding Zn-ribbon protein